MLRYLMVIGALAAMPLKSFAAVQSVDKSAAESTAQVERGNMEGPVWVVEAAKSQSSRGPVWVVMQSKGAKRSHEMRPLDRPTRTGLTT